MSRSRFRTLSIFLLAIYLTTGCSKVGIAPLRPVILPDNKGVSSPAVAVGPDGGRHWAWWEIDSQTGRSGITYHYEGPAGKNTLSFTGAPSDYYEPSLVVTDDNLVYLVWLKATLPSTKRSTCWAVFQSMAPGAPDCIPASTLMADPKVRVMPRIATNGATVYAAFYGQIGDKVYLLLRNLSSTEDEVNTGIYVDAKEGAFVDTSLAVGSAGKPSVATVRRVSFPDLYRLSYATRGASSVTVFDDLITGSSMSAPGLTIDRVNNDRVHFGTVVAGKELAVFTSDVSDTVGPIVVKPLSADTSWKIKGAPAFTMVPSDASNPKPALFVAFTGGNDSTGDKSEIFYYMRNSAGAASVVRATTDGATVDKSEPRAAAYAHPDGNTIVIAWRTHATYLYTDVYVFDLLNKARRVHESRQSSVVEVNLALAGRGDQVAGIFISAPPDLANRNIPWLAYNAELTYLPAVIR